MHGDRRGLQRLLRLEGVVVYCPAAGACQGFQGTAPKGGGGCPPSTDPKMVVQNNGFCGRRRFCFRHTAGGNFLFDPVSILKILIILWRIQKWLKSTKKDFDPDPTSGRTLADGSLS